MSIRVLHVGAHEDLVMNYQRNFDSRDIVFDFVLRRGGREFRYLHDASFNGVLHYLTPLSESRRKWMSELRSTVRRGNYSHVHLHVGWSNALALAALQGLRTVTISHAHSVYPEEALRIRGRNIFARKTISKRSNVRLACSAAAGRQMFDREFQVIPNIIQYERFQFDEEARFRVRKQLGIGKRSVVIGHVGQFVAAKNHRMLIDILKVLVADGRDVKLLLVGSGDETLDFVTTQLRKERLENHVLFTGDTPDVGSYLSTMDLFLFPSHFEGFGMALLEAQVNGLTGLFSAHLPRDAVISTSVKPLALERGPEYWGRQAMSILDSGESGRARVRRSLSVSKKFDASSQAWRLEQIYATRV